MPEPGNAAGYDNVHTVVANLVRQLEFGRATKVGFPGADDIDYSPLYPLWNYELNNVGDPYDDPVFAHHTKPFERAAVEFFADLFGAAPDDRWGYITTGGTENLQFGLLRARQIYPDGVAYYSTSAHYKVPRVLSDFRMPSVEVPSTEFGEMSYAALARAVAAHRNRPAIVVATAGTTMTEAVDDVGAVHAVLDDCGVLDRYVHVDAALAGVPLALLPPSQRPRFDLRAGADSIGVSLHKFLATRQPGGIVVTRRSAPPTSRRSIAYTGAADSVMTCSRNGHLAMMAWYCAHALGRDGLRRRAEAARATAEYLVHELRGIGWPAWRHPHAFTVVLGTPPAEVLRRWQLATEGQWSHYVCLPGRGTEQVDRFVAELASLAGEAVSAVGLDSSAAMPVAASNPDVVLTGRSEAHGLGKSLGVNRVFG